MTLILKIIRYLAIEILLFFTRHKKNRGKYIVFMPHSGFSKNDFCDLFNYCSDSSMTFANYLLSNNLCFDKVFVLFVPNDIFLDESYRKARELYPDYSFVFLTWDSFLLDYSNPDCIRKTKDFCKCIINSSHIFVSITYRLEKYVSDQIVVDLNYYPAPLKNDFLPPTSKYYMKLEQVGKKYNKVIFTSEVAIRLEMPSMSLPHDHYADFGLCRNDNLLNDNSYSEVRKIVLSSVSYAANKIIIYTPTHRDYEQENTHVARSLFGYTMDFNELDQVLREEGIIIVCKVHPKQNKVAISKELPESVIIHQANHEYGLTELMKVSDCMIADYSTGYFDYLLLDKPVIFNFYDVERYNKERGFTYDPIESIVAGDIVKTPEQLLSALRGIERNRVHWREKRTFVRDLFFKYQDGKSCQRVYEHYFNK